ncbi:MAG: DUF4097 family beta strand repeat-containing protein [Pseudomonadota bacterium]
MNILLRTGAALLAALPLSATAELITDKDFDYRLDDVAADGLVEIDNVSGSIEVEGIDGRYVRVAGELGKNVEGVEVTRSGKNVRVRVRHDKDENQHGGTDLRVWLPQGADVEVAAVSAKVEVRNVRGAQRLNSVSGDVETEAFSENVSASSVSGDVSVRGSGGDMDEVDLGSVSGDVIGTRLHGDIEAKSVSGDVVVRDSVVRRGSFESTSGDLEVSGSLGDDSRLTFQTVSGDVEFIVDGATDGTYMMRSFSGDLTNCFGPELPESDRNNKRHRFEMGKGLARIEASTMSGDVEFCQ